MVATSSCSTSMASSLPCSIAARMKEHLSTRRYQRSRVGEMLRCPWHGWEFDIRNGQSYFDPARVKIRSYPVVIEDGETLAKGPFVAETFPVFVEDSYVVVEIGI
jgi:hypothetical protein